MDIELTPAKLSATELQSIAQRVVEGGMDAGIALALLLHIQAQDDEIEATRARLDPYLDHAHGSPAHAAH